MADIRVQDKYGVNFMTYWFDEKRQSVFCLVDAPNMSAVRKLSFVALTTEAFERVAGFYREGLGLEAAHVWPDA